MRLELSEADFCPECCGVLQVAGTGPKAGLRCTSCYASYRPVKEEKNAEAAER